MANYRAMAATTAALAGMLHERYPRDEFPNPVTIKAIQPKDIDGLTGDGVAILLWRVAINTQRRSLSPRTDIFGRKFKASLPLDLSILLIPYASDAEVQHRLMGWTMRALADAGPLTATQLNNYLAEEDIFAAIEEVDLVCDPLGVADYLSLWDRMKKFPLSINYVVRMMLLDSQQPLSEAAAVVERRFDTGLVEQ